MSLSTTATPLRRLARVTVAAALIALPLGALAATASAETPAAPGVVQVVDAPQQGADINGHRHFKHHHGAGRGPQDGPWHNGPQHHFRHFLPPTGSS
ncbi:hypothetical protein [Nocardia sp. R7R-8]|uniref:hypothetical protein n=1 Tax=Nocardia sp. R7R-8 TaxID=3459304 RepID=UPI00403DED35